MITLPTGFQSELEATVSRGVLVYDLELTAGTLHYSSQSVGPWTHPDDGSITYTKLAVKSSPIIEVMDPGRTPEVTVTFSNVGNTLRSNLEPTDNITGRRMTIRLLMRNSSDAILADSLILFRGFMQRPRRVTQDKIEIQVFGLIHGFPTAIPNRRFHRQCDWAYASAGAFDGTGECPYQSTTLAFGDGDSSTALTVDDGTNLADGDEIIIGAASNAAVGIASGGGTTSITLDEATSWSDNDPVRLAECSREFPDCVQRVDLTLGSDLTHRYGGFRGVEDQASAIKLFGGTSFGSFVTGNASNFDFIPSGLVELMVRSWLQKFGLPESQSLEELGKIVPLIYGRREVSGKLVEAHSVVYPDTVTVFAVQIYVLSEGEIDSIVDYYTEEGKGSFNDTTYTSGKRRRKLGYFYRTGEVGLDASELITDYDLLTDGNTKRDQNRDYYSAVADTLSRTAYATFLQNQGFESKGGPPIPPEIVPTFDVKGVKCQKYTDADPATTTGVPVFTRNPIWQSVDFCISETGRLGLLITDADIDFTVTEPQADVCDVTIEGNAATVVATTDEDTAATYDVWEVDDTEQFTRGMLVKYDDGVSPVTGEVINLWSETKMRLEIADQTVSGTDTITPQLPRWTCDLALDSARSPGRQISEILKTCAGYITYADGKIQFRVESTGSATDHYRDTGYAAGYGIIKDSFEWLAQATPDTGINRVIVRYTSQEGERLEAGATDWNHRKTYPARTESIDAPGVDNRNQAYRLASLILAKSRTLDTSARFRVGPIGMQLQPGDLIDVTHTVPNWSGETKRIVKKEVFQLGDRKEFEVRLTVVDYDATIYTDDPPPRIDSSRPNKTDPSITLSVDSVAGKIILTWTAAANVSKVLGYSVFRHTATMGSTPLATGDWIAAGIKSTQYIYIPSDDEIGTTLYFMVTAKVGTIANNLRVLSNEVTAVATGTDPTDSEDVPGENLVYDGDFSVGAWEVTDPTSVTVDPTHGGAYTDRTAYTNPGNALDGDGDTDATSAASRGGSVWNLSTAANVTGYWQWTHDKVGSGRGFFQYSENGGTDKLPAGALSLDEKQTHTTPVISAVDRADIEFYTLANARAGWTHSVYEIDWIEISSGVFSQISGSEGSIRGNGSGTPTASDYGTLKRPFPGEYGVEDYTLAAGQEWVVQLWVRKAEAGTDTHDVLVQLREIDDDTYTTLMTVEFEDITTSYQGFAAKYTVPTKVTGAWEIVVRTLNPFTYNVDKLSIVPGQKIFAFAVNKDEVNQEVDNRHGLRGAYETGDWTALGDSTETKKASVT